MVALILCGYLAEVRPRQEIDIAKHSETMEEMVVYRALYGEHDLWVRPASMWNET